MKYNDQHVQFTRCTTTLRGELNGTGVLTVPRSSIWYAGARDSAASMDWFVKGARILPTVFRVLVRDFVWVAILTEKLVQVSLLGSGERGLYNISTRLRLPCERCQQRMPYHRILPFLEHPMDACMFIA
jgi:hypothetical protein